MTPPAVDFDAINRGFSDKALVYDDYGRDHPVMLWTRIQVREHLLSLVPPGSHVLELAAGTGSDAVYLAERGYHVHATDLATGMVAEIRRKIARFGLGDRMTAQELSFTDLDRVEGGPYDLVFSNSGGLNCLPDLTMMTRGLPRVVKPGGYVALVIMPYLCPWEMGQAFRGNFKTAFRRLRPGGVMSRVASAHFMTYYFQPRQVLRALGPGFRRVGLKSYSTFSPPSYLEKFTRSHPRLYRLLTGLDRRLAWLPPFNAMGDFFILTVQAAR